MCCKWNNKDFQTNNFGLSLETLNHYLKFRDMCCWISLEEQLAKNLWHCLACLFQHVSRMDWLEDIHIENIRIKSSRFYACWSPVFPILNILNVGLDILRFRMNWKRWFQCCFKKSTRVFRYLIHLLEAARLLILTFKLYLRAHP